MKKDPTQPVFTLILAVGFGGLTAISTIARIVK